MMQMRRPVPVGLKEKFKRSKQLFGTDRQPGFLLEFTVQCIRQRLEIFQTPARQIIPVRVRSTLLMNDEQFSFIIIDAVCTECPVKCRFVCIYDSSSSVYAVNHRSTDCNAPSKCPPNVGSLSVPSSVTLFCNAPSSRIGR